MKLTTSLPTEVVRTQLARIIESRQFCNAPRLSRFLTYLVEEALAGRADRLKGYTIGIDVFDRPKDFDPQTDTIVRVQARALRQKLEQFYVQDGQDDPIHIAIEKGSYEPSFFLSWDGERPSAIKPDAIGTSTAKPSIAVLPFDNYSPDAANEFISHGLTEETIANLSRFKEISVFSRSTMETVKLNKMTIPQIQEALGADFVLEGSLMIRDGRIDVSINLVDAVADSIVLVDHFCDRMELPAFYEMQDRMAMRIAARITDRFGPLGLYARRAAAEGRSQKWETYNWISRYHQLSFELSPVERAEIRDGLLSVLEEDDGSSDAHAVLALVLADEYHMPPAGGDDLLPQMMEQARLAVSCDPQNAVAHKALAMARFFAGDLEGFDRSARLALSLNPGYGELLAKLGTCYAALAKWDVAVDLLDQAIALNPVHAGWFHTVKAIAIAMTAGPAEAKVEIERAPIAAAFFYHAYLTWFLVEMGDMEGALREKARLLEVEPDFECFFFRHARAWHIDPAIIDRAVAAWRKVGFTFPGWAAGEPGGKTS
ncbi:tetratricopeptide repeat protein [Roseovarius sp. S4756]|uniref:tetratricopeptide repeat protein n=1 Tax=Roseovarius maritimus TaxID=3342637 RepID=UPI00372A3D2E